MKFFLSLLAAAALAACTSTDVLRADAETDFPIPTAGVSQSLSGAPTGDYLLTDMPAGAPQYAVIRTGAGDGILAGAASFGIAGLTRVTLARDGAGEQFYQTGAFANGEFVSRNFAANLPIVATFALGMRRTEIPLVTPPPSGLAVYSGASNNPAAVELVAVNAVRGIERPLAVISPRNAGRGCAGYAIGLAPGFIARGLDTSLFVSAPTGEAARFTLVRLGDVISVRIEGVSLVEIEDGSPGDLWETACLGGDGASAVVSQAANFGPSRDFPAPLTLQEWYFDGATMARAKLRAHGDSFGQHYTAPASAPADLLSQFTLGPPARLLIDDLVIGTRQLDLDAE